MKWGLGVPPLRRGWVTLGFVPSDPGGRPSQPSSLEKKHGSAPLVDIPFRPEQPPTEAPTEAKVQLLGPSFSALPSDLHQAHLCSCFHL